MNQYSLHEKIGSGGYAEVFRCTDKIGVRYACKVLPKGVNKRERIKHEVDIMRRLTSCTKVPRLVDALEDTNNYYIVQEWCKGGMVKEYVCAHDAYSENTVASIVRGVLRGLYQIHSAGVIHCDIKASNVLFADRENDAEVKLADFGTAVAYDPEKEGLVEVAELVGTPWFMSPESLSHKVGPRTDIWSVGVMTYQLLSGSLPFNDRENSMHPSISRIWYSILHEKPLFKGQKWAHVSNEARNFVEICLIKDPTQRPGVLEALQHPWLNMSECKDRFTGSELTVKPF